jgi:GNAT superfamily N-acetyltransferase
MVAKELNEEIFPGCENLAFENDYIWLAFGEKDQVLGFATLRPFLREKFGFFDRVGVLRAYRGLKLQKRFIKTRLSLCRKLGLKRIVTYTVRNNYASINSLVHSGFYLFEPQWKWAGIEMLYFIYYLR